MDNTLPVPHKKPGRKPSGRTTIAFNMRMEVGLKARLQQAATKKRPQSTIVEEALVKALPPIDPLS